MALKVSRGETGWTKRKWPPVGSEDAQPLPIQVSILPASNTSWNNEFALGPEGSEYGGIPHF